MILLDTNALIWLHDGHPRAAELARTATRLHVSPITLLEMQVLTESGRMRLQRGATPREIIADERWVLDDPPSSDWFDASLDVGWTRDVFDRLIVAHARLRRWRLATADANIIGHLSPREYLEL
ncbi:MAG: PIN domain-containing protein [Acidobacteria bacterium]|nr:PIN domain-containing protein [Acidobacteriota bacterium]